MTRMIVTVLASYVLTLILAIPIAVFMAKKIKKASQD